MSACKDKYRWCKDEPSVYKNSEGMEYCVFHAPKGSKGTSLDGFNQAVYARINHAILNKQFYNLSGTIFEGDIGFNIYNKDNPFPRINFSKTTFSGEVDFGGSVFSGEVWFSNAKFRSKAWFALAKFSEKANFFDAIFGGEALFLGAVFGGEADFSNATFAKDKKAWFFDAKFSEKTWFAGARLGGEAKFSDATFSEEADFSFTTFSEKADFSLAKFNGGAYFYGGTFKRGTDEEDVDTVVFEKGAKFQNFSAKEKIRFEGVNLKEVSFLDSDLRQADFINCDWQKKSGREVLYDEVSIFGKKGKGLQQRDSEEIKKEGKNREKIRKVGILYRKLKQKYVDEHDWPEVSSWHYGEKEMIRKQDLWGQIFFSEDIFKYKFLQKLLRKFSYDLYWLFGGYGERPVRAGV